MNKTKLIDVVMNGVDFQAEFIADAEDGSIVLYSVKHRGDDILDLLNEEALMTIEQLIENYLELMGYE